MELYLIRHGVAEQRGDDYPDDTKRPLTKEGKAGLRKEAKGLNAIGVELDAILTSPLVRTRQTADVLAEYLKPAPPIANVDALAPSGTPDAAIEELALHAGKTRLAMVGHEPNIGELAAALIGLRHPLPFRKGAVCRIDFEEAPARGKGQLRWFATPRILKKLA